MSAYRTAIDGTGRAIERRARYFRNQIIIVLAISTLVVVAAVVTRSAAALWGWLLLIPTCGVFFYTDDRAVRQWRSGVLTMWIAREVDCAGLRQAIRANPALPKGTTEGMTMTLPESGDLVAEQKILTPTRQAIAAASLALHRDRAEQLLLNVIASGIVVGAVLPAVWMRAWAPLLGLATLAALPVARAWATRRGRARCEAEVAACRAQVGFSEPDYARICAALR